MFFRILRASEREKRVAFRARGLALSAAMASGSSPARFRALGSAPSPSVCENNHQNNTTFTRVAREREREPRSPFLEKPALDDVAGGGFSNPSLSRSRLRSRGSVTRRKALVPRFLCTIFRGSLLFGGAESAGSPTFAAQDRDGACVLSEKGKRPRVRARGMSLRGGRDAAVSIRPKFCWDLLVALETDGFFERARRDAVRFCERAKPRRAQRWSAASPGAAPAPVLSRNYTEGVFVSDLDVSESCNVARVPLANTKTTLGRPQ